MFGTVKFFNHQRGFGFIIPEDGGKDLFFHVTACEEGYEPNENDRVSFELGETPKGPAATQVKFVGGAASGDAAMPGESASFAADESDEDDYEEEGETA